MVSPKEFDAEVFLTTVGPGRTISTYKPKDIFFAKALNATQFSMSRRIMSNSSSCLNRKGGPWGCLALALSSAKEPWQVIRTTSHRVGPPRKQPWSA